MPSINFNGRKSWGLEFDTERGGKKGDGVSRNLLSGLRFVVDQLWDLELTSLRKRKPAALSSDT